MKIQQVHAIAYRIELEKCEKENERLRREMGMLLEVVENASNADDLNDEFARLREGTG